MDQQGELLLPSGSSLQHSRPDSLSDSTTTDPSPTPASSENGSTCKSRENAVGTTKDALVRLLGDRGVAMVAALDRSKPLHLLELPLDILSLIVKEITHTNDLCAVALSHSILHSLAIPHIYSRFDIVWPDTTTSVEPRSGVDALTYGLATLVMHEDVFGEAQFQKQRQDHPTSLSICTKCGHCDSPRPSIMAPPAQLPSLGRRRRGNNYASFTRKFSLGNGPADWVQEYRVTTDSGKMLGSLVALALARMRNLETFIWDMPTGIPRDVWVALASLGEHNDGHGCRLEKVWVRWHSNAMVEGNVAPPGSPYHEANTFPQPVSGGVGLSSTNDASITRHNIINKVERPTFSILPPLRSLNVLDIDELAYLDEMSALISVSKHSLRELRVGIAKEASGCDWTGAWEDNGLQQLPAKKANPLGGTSHFEKRLGGVLGVLVGNIYDIRHKQSKVAEPPASSPIIQTGTDYAQTIASRTQQESASIMAELESSGAARGPPLSSDTQDGVLKITSEMQKPVNPRFTENLPPSERMTDISNAQNSVSINKPKQAGEVADLKSTDHRDSLSSVETHRLNIKTLELERVPLSVSVLCGSLDWSKLSELTILDCPNHEQLWKVLRRRYSPKASPRAFAEHSNLTSGRRTSKSLPSESLDYELRLRKVYTNTVTMSLISFLRETLAPNSLETLFLQQSKHYTSKVGIETIFRGPIRRHRASLKQLSIDSRHRDREEGTAAIGYRKWAFDRELLSFVISGKMPRLREFAISIDIKDWHYFLQRLPQVPHLRSLYIPFVSKDATHVMDNEAKELALQIIDIITLRPEIELCYLAIAGKCFEVLEAQATDRDMRGSDSSLGTGPESADSDEEDDDVDEEDPDEADGEGDDGDTNVVAPNTGEDDDETETEEEDFQSEDEVDGEHTLDLGKSRTRLRLREILFYDDKIAIFKARHGRL